VEIMFSGLMLVMDGNKKCWDNMASNVVELYIASQIG
jgi:hypothetical protein